MAFDFDDTLATIKDRQWALADFDWTAPGADRMSEAQRRKIKPFMADLVWIEHIGARGFAAMARTAPNETLKEIYRYFHAEEQRHANAELALMRRWGMLDDGEVPRPNINVRLAIEVLDRDCDHLPFSALGSLIPMLEVALDGALLKFLLEEVTDPVCHQVFHKINADESRHLAVGFAALDMLGAAPVRRRLLDLARILRPGIVLGVIDYVALLNRMRNNLVEMGISEQRLYAAMSRYGTNGDRSPRTRRLPTYQLFKHHGRMVANREHPYHYVADFLVRATARYPSWLERPLASWSKELTHEPVHG